MLFTDLADSTGRRVRSGEEAADAIRLRHDRLVRSAIVSEGGRVAKHTGDGVMAIFTGASEAITAAVAIQQVIDVHNARSDDEPLQVRIGLSVGDVAIEGEDCFGLPVVEAQRLESAAKPGQILISSLVRALARGRGGHEFRPLGALDLKGLDAPLEAEEVAWTPLDKNVAASDRPPALMQRGGFAFAGRRSERQALEEVWAQGVAGACRLVFLAGEPGIGKTRLASEFAAGVAGSGGHVLAGRCDEMVSVPYQPFAEALQFQLTKPDIASSLGDMPEELTRLSPAVNEVVPGLRAPFSATPDAERLHFFDAVRSWLACLARLEPLLMVLDDIHWADAGTLLLLRHIVATDPVPRLVVLTTYRDTDLDRTHPLSMMLSDFHRRADTIRVSLKGLDEADVAEFVTLASGQELDRDAERLVRALCEETGGNPFFAGEVLRHLVESGAIFQRGGRWVAATLTERDLPEGVREVVGRRLSAMPEPTQKMLSTASVIGARFDLDLLCIVAKADDDDVIDALEPAITAQLVVETGVGRYQFAHALIRSTLHHELSTTRRARLHRAVAEALIKLYGDETDGIVTDLAYHYGEAGAAAATEEALHYARRAATVAIERLAPDEAIRWSRTALELLDDEDPRARAEVMGALAQAEYIAGLDGWEATQCRAVRAALDVDDLTTASTVIRLSGRLVTTIDQPAQPEKALLLEELIERIPEDATGERATLLTMLASTALFGGDLTKRDRLLAEVDEMIRPLDPVERFSVRSLGLVFRGQAHLTAADDDTDLEMALPAKNAEDPMIRCNALSNIFRVEMARGRGQQMRAAFAEFGEALRSFPHPIYTDFFVLESMRLALIDGRIGDAEAEASRFFQLSSAHGRTGEAILYSTVSSLGIARERTGYAPLADLLVRTAQTEGQPKALWSVATLALFEAGRTEEAQAALHEHARNGFRDLVDDSSWNFAIAYWAEAAAALRDGESCRALYDILRPKHGVVLWTGGFFAGSAARSLGMLASVLGLPDADAWFDEALTVHVGIESPTWTARTHLDWAEHLLGLGQREAARTHAQEAIAVIGDLELTASRARAETILGAIDQS